jgi:ribosomal protein S18 acetylase RimI-like enzyme
MSHLLATSKGVITIRPAVPDDAAPLRELRLEALADYPAAFAADYAMTAAESAATWTERIARYATDNSGAICIAASEDRLIGMMGVGCGHWPKTRHGGVIWGVYVTPAWRGRRVAEALMNECVAWAQAQGLAVVKLGVITTNTPAIRCYARCGFTVYGIEPTVIHHNGVFYDELLMARQV